MKELRILVDEEKHTVTILRDDGAKIEVKGIALFAGDAEGTQASFAFCFGSAADAAWATAFHYKNVLLRKYFALLSAFIVKQTCPEAMMETVDPEDVLARWEKTGKVTYN